MSGTSVQATSACSHLEDWIRVGDGAAADVHEQVLVEIVRVPLLLHVRGELNQTNLVSGDGAALPRWSARLGGGEKRDNFSRVMSMDYVRRDDDFLPVLPRVLTWRRPPPRKACCTS